MEKIIAEKYSSTQMEYVDKMPCKSVSNYSDFLKVTWSMKKELILHISREIYAPFYHYQFEGDMWQFIDIYHLSIVL